jgi:hypothetical protein
VERREAEAPEAAEGPRLWTRKKNADGLKARPQNPDSGRVNPAGEKDLTRPERESMLFMLAFFSILSKPPPSEPRGFSV